MPVSPTPIPAPVPTARVNTRRVRATVPTPNPRVAAARPIITMARGFHRATAQPASGPKTAPPVHMRVMVKAVAAREPPNSARSGGKKTGNVLVTPATSSVQEKASTRRPLARLSRAAVTLRLWPIVTAMAPPVDSVPSRS